jgi:3-hydroxyisobutyrate dehydrogenase
VADTSTISPEESKFCAHCFREARIAMLGMPVMGGTTAAESGELIPIICGSRKAFEKVAHIIKNISKAMFYLGERDKVQHSQASLESKYWPNSWGDV